MRNILIIGGGGYVGVELTKYLLQKKFHVTVFDIFLYGKNILMPHPNLKTIIADIRDRDKVKMAMKNIDAVIHLACLSNDPGYELSPQIGFEVNFLAFEPIVKAAIDMKVSRFLYPSSCSIYGIGQGDILDEKSLLNPLTDYAKCKALCEEVLKSYSSRQFHTIILRPATIYGYSDRQRLDLTVNGLINDIFHNEIVTLKGADKIRPSLHIKDMIRAYYILLHNCKEFSGEVFNLGYENITIKEIATKISTFLNPKVQFIYDETNDKRSYVISSEKIKKRLKFLPLYSINDASEDLANAIRSGKLSNTFKNKYYYNKAIQKESNFSITIKSNNIS